MMCEGKTSRVYFLSIIDKQRFYFHRMRSGSSSALIEAFEGIFMLSRRYPLFMAIVVGLLAGVGYPFVDLALACRVPTSEACVWGRAYFPLTLTLSVLIIGGPVAGLLYGVLTWWRRQSGNGAV